MQKEVRAVIHAFRAKPGFTAATLSAATALALMTTAGWPLLGRLWWFVPLATVWSFLIAAPADEPLENAGLFGLISGLSVAGILYLLQRFPRPSAVQLFLGFLFLGLYGGVVAGLFLCAPKFPTRKDYDDLLKKSQYAGLAVGFVLAFFVKLKDASTANGLFRFIICFVGFAFFAGVNAGGVFGREARRLWRSWLGLPPDPAA